MNRRRLIAPLVLLVLSLLWTAIATKAQTTSSAPVWTVLTFDPKGDARDPQAGDAALLSYRYDQRTDVLWFRVNLYGKANEQSFGINFAIDNGDETNKIDWWGANKNFKFDRLVTAWVSRRDGRYEGTMGVADAAGISASQFNNLLQNDLQIRTERDAILIGIKRADISSKQKLNLIASIGTSQQSNDELPNAGSATIDLTTGRPAQFIRELDFTRNNFALPAQYKTIADSAPPIVTKHGQGKQAMILVPGMYSGPHSFDEFISRNQSRYKIYVMTPPGINGTPARRNPANAARLGDLTWTRLLERDLLNLIRREKLARPVIVAERQPGSIAAVELAQQHPEEVGGVILVATNLVQSFPSPKDPTRKSPIPAVDRPAYIEETWAALWFKYVTPKTWNSGDLPAPLFSADSAKGQRAWQDVEAAPLEVKIRYLCEFWASDVTAQFDQLRVPVLALIPTFDEKFLADPANGFARNSIVGSWDTLIPKHPQLTLVRISDARLFLLDEQPGKADAAIAAFLQQIRDIDKK